MVAHSTRAEFWLQISQAVETLRWLPALCPSVWQMGQKNPA